MSRSPVNSTPFPVLLVMLITSHNSICQTLPETHHSSGSNQFAQLQGHNNRNDQGVPSHQGSFPGHHSMLSQHSQPIASSTNVQNQYPFHYPHHAQGQNYGRPTFQNPIQGTAYPYIPRFNYPTPQVAPGFSKGGFNTFGNTVKFGSNAVIGILPPHRGHDIAYRYGDTFLNNALYGHNGGFFYVGSSQKSEFSLAKIFEVIVRNLPTISKAIEKILLKKGS